MNRPPLIPNKLALAWLAVGAVLLAFVPLRLMELALTISMRGAA